ncbi:MAG TPA: DUF2891 domain-containing protein [Gemmatimonadaceae bacterium]|nr:DUF2891 domain-containing protein [Gemmatimonadaceae bacterium]
MKTAAISLTLPLAAKFGGVALAHLTREYPNKLEHVLNDDRDAMTPRQLHPVFFGSFDWHSCVHGYWLLATMLRRFPSIQLGHEITAVFDAQLTESKIAGEVEYLRRPLRGTFERPYGWAWLLMLSAELARHETDGGGRWSRTLQPLTDAFVDRFASFLPKATYPIRVGTHFNSAFALALALEYAVEVRDTGFADLLKAKARAWFGEDRDCQAWEPGGDDFLSSALMEAECMRRALAPGEFTVWVSKFLPGIAERSPSTLFEPAEVSDRSDGKIAHLDGLNLSRAWCWKSLAGAWPEGDRRRGAAITAAQTHLDAGLAHVVGDYMGEHWLATFAVLALMDS